MLSTLFSKNSARRAGEDLYAAAVEQARTQKLYAELGAPDTVEGRFEMVALHVWLLLRRLKGDNRRAKAVAQGLFDATFSGFDDALREMGVGDLSVGRRIRTLGENFYGRMKAYDAALDEGADGLAEALARNVFLSSDRDVAKNLAIYTHEMIAQVDGAPFEDLLAGKAGFRGGEAEKDTGP